MQCEQSGVQAAPCADLPGSLHYAGPKNVLEDLGGLKSTWLQRGPSQASSHLSPCFLTLSLTELDAGRTEPPCNASSQGPGQATLSSARVTCLVPQHGCSRGPLEPPCIFPPYLPASNQWTCMQAARNHHAMLAVRALARLVGVLPGSLASPPNMAAAGALSSLLTPSLAEQLADMDPRPLLRQLTGSVRSPHTIWDGRMRDELLGLLEGMRSDPAGTALPNRSFQYKVGKHLRWPPPFLRSACP